MSISVSYYHLLPDDVSVVNAILSVASHLSKPPDRINFVKVSLSSGTGVTVQPYYLESSKVFSMYQHA